MPKRQEPSSFELELLRRERSLRRRGFRAIAGVDEAGRGPLAGPVVAAACIFSSNAPILGVNDSKKLTRQQRQSLHAQLTAHPALHYGVGIIDSEEIDRINIYQATIRAMQVAIAALPIIPDYLLVDGLQLPYPEVPVEKVIGGDGVCYAIAAASIIAKEVRDRLMEEYDGQWPEYGFAQHKGYGTELHRAALQKYGPCPIHRRSFKFS